MNRFLQHHEKAVEIDTRLFEWQPAIIENTADFGFKIGDDGFVINPQDFTGQDLIPMRHQLGITAIIAPDFLKAIGELLTFRE